MYKKFQQIELENRIPVSIFYQVLAALSISIIGLLTKLLKRVPTTQLLIHRNFFQIIISMLIQYILKEQQSSYVEEKSVRNKVYLRAFLGSLDSYLYFKAIMMVSLSEAVVLISTAPLWTAFIMIYILRRQPSSIKLLLTIVVCLFGICLISKPPFINNFLLNIGLIEEIPLVTNDQDQHTLGVVSIILAAILFATEQIIMRDLGDQVSPVVIVDQLSYGIVISSALIQVFLGIAVILTIYEILVIALIALVGFSYQFLITRSFSIGNVTQLSLIGNIQIIFSLFFDFLILDSKMDTLGIIGSTIMLSCIIFIAVSK